MVLWYTIIVWNAEVNENGDYYACSKSKEHSFLLNISEMKQHYLLSYQAFYLVNLIN